MKVNFRFCTSKEQLIECEEDCTEPAGMGGGTLMDNIKGRRFNTFRLRRFSLIEVGEGIISENWGPGVKGSSISSGEGELK